MLDDKDKFVKDDLVDRAERFVLDDKDSFEDGSEAWATSWLEASHQAAFWPIFNLSKWLVNYAPYLDRALRIRGALPYSCSKPIWWSECRTHAQEPVVTTQKGKP